MYAHTIRPILKRRCGTAILVGKLDYGVSWMVLLIEDMKYSCPWTKIPPLTDACAGSSNMSRWICASPLLLLVTTWTTRSTSAKAYRHAHKPTLTVTLYGSYQIRLTSKRQMASTAASRTRLRSRRSRNSIGKLPVPVLELTLRGRSLALGLLHSENRVIYAR